MRGALLQQGSLLLGDAHVKLASVVRASEAERAALAAAWRQAAAGAGRLLGDDRSLARLAGALAESLAGEAAVRRLEGEAAARALGVEEEPRRSAGDCLGGGRLYTAPRS